MSKTQKSKDKKEGLQLIERIYEEPTAKFIFNGEKMNALLKNQKQCQNGHSCHFCLTYNWLFCKC